MSDSVTPNMMKTIGTYCISVAKTNDELFPEYTLHINGLRGNDLFLGIAKEIYDALLAGALDELPDD